MNTKRLIAGAGLLAATGSCLAQGNYGFDDPSVRAKYTEIDAHVEKGRSLAKGGHLDEATLEFNQAISVEGSLKGFRRWAYSELALALANAGKTQEALDAFKHVFRWNADKADLESGAGYRIVPFDYAILLARSGDVDGAKAMYYFGMRLFNDACDRTKEPVPYLTVFDPEPNSDSWDYSSDRLEAACLLLKSTESSRDEPKHGAWHARAAQLWPEWLAPVLWQTRGTAYPEAASSVVSQAEGLAKTDLERALVAGYKADLDYLAKHNKEADTPLAFDSRPMKEGHERRLQMRCLQPDHSVLKRLTE